MKRKAVPFAAAMLLLLTLSGCARLIEREYSYVADHPRDYIEENNGQFLIVENYQGLRSAIMYFVSEMADTGVIRLSKYTGNIANDVAEACLDISRNDPIGAFCVDYITHDYSRIVSYYEITLNFYYSRTREEVDSIVHIYSLDRAKKELAEAYTDRDESLLLRCYNYDDWADELSQYISSIYYELPAYALAFPTVNVQTYPESGQQRILEVNIEYDFSTRVLSIRTERLKTISQKLINTLRLTSDPEDGQVAADSLYALCGWLGENVVYDYDSEDNAFFDESYVKGSPFTAYGALHDGKAASEGYSLAVKLICDMLDIDCRVVQGRRGGFFHCWNIVRIGDGYYHLDPSTFSDPELSPVFLLSDTSLSDEYRWNLSNYPICAESWPMEELQEDSSPEAGGETPAGPQDPLASPSADAPPEARPDAQPEPGISEESPQPEPHEDQTE